MKPPVKPDLPADIILEVLQTSGHPALMNMPKESWHEIDNCLRKTVELRQRPRYFPAVIRPSDVEFELTFFDEVKKGKKTVIVERKEPYFIRKMDTGDMYDVASIGPQILEEFFSNDIAQVSLMTYDKLIFEVMSKAMASRIQNCMTDLAEAIIHKVCDLIVHKETKHPLGIQEFFQLDPVEGYQAHERALKVNTLFFSYLTSKIPENIKDTISSLTGMLSSGGSLLGEILSTKE